MNIHVHHHVILSVDPELAALLDRLAGPSVPQELVDELLKAKDKSDAVKTALVAAQH